MKEILVHIGYHKTGSTWLQKELFSAKSRHFVPLSWDEDKQSSLARLLYADQSGQLLSPFDHNTEQVNQELQKIITSGIHDFTNKNWVISRERLSGHPSSGGFDALAIAERISTNFDKPKVLIMIREQKSAILSHYFQYLQEGGTFSLKKMLTTHYDDFRPYFSKNYLKYDGLIKHYQQLFGEDHVLVLPYEIFKHQPEIFFDRLGKYVDLDLSGYAKKASEKIVNKKSYHFSKYHLRALNVLINKNSYTNYSFWSNFITRKLAKFFILTFGLLTSPLDKRLKTRLQNEIDNLIGDYYVPSNEKLKKLLPDLDFSKYNYF